MKDSFFAGLRIILPIVLFIIILSWVIGTLFSGIEAVESLFPGTMIDAVGLPEIVIKLVCLILFCVIVWIIGVISKQSRMSKNFKNWLDPIITRIPLLSHLFKITNQVASSLGDTKSFKRVVFVPWPHGMAWALGFITNEKPSFRNYFPEPENMVSVVVPASPLTSHWPLMMNRRNLIETEISVAEAISNILSLGVAGATEKLMEESHSDLGWDFFICLCMNSRYN